MWPFWQLRRQAENTHTALNRPNDGGWKLLRKTIYEEVWKRTKTLAQRVIGRALYTHTTLLVWRRRGASSNGNTEVADARNPASRERSIGEKARRALGK
jgi:hypothetical protein